MKWKEFVEDYLSFTRRDRIGIIVILVIMAAVFFLPVILSRKGQKGPQKADKSWMVSLKKLEQTETAGERSYPQYNEDNSTTYQYDRSENNYRGKKKGELFYFDPNTLTASEWQKLGLREKTIQTIQNYLDKGGHFRKPEDLQRIYGLFPDEFERLAPFIQIAVPDEAGNKNYSRSLPASGEPSVTSFSPRYKVIDINLADSVALNALPGIGPVLAARIIRFREKLGGFYKVSQVGETYGLPDSTFRKIMPYLKLDNPAVRMININLATADELTAHPYIRYNLAKPILAYRNEHGSFSNPEDIRKVMAVTDEVYQKIAPYLTTQ